MQEIEKSKVIYIDYGYFTHANGFLWMDTLKRKLDLKSDEEIDYNKMKRAIIPASYNGFNSIISNLKKIGLNKSDIVILAGEGRNNWRKEIIKEYKAGRRKLTVELYGEFDWLKERLDTYSPFHFISINTLEADDLIAVGVKYFKNNLNIIVSTDKDFLQLLVRDNVRIFSPHSKAKKCPYRILHLDRQKEITKAYKVLSDKIKKEASDNLVSDILTEIDHDKREMLVNLLSLPKFVEERVIEELQEITVKSEDDYDINELPFQSIRNRFNDIYKKDKIVSYESCKLKFAKKLLNKKKTKKKGVK